MGKESETISVTELRNSTREVIENAHFRGRRYLVERAGQAMVTILGVEEYQRLVRTPALPEPPAEAERPADTH